MWNQWSQYAAAPPLPTTAPPPPPQEPVAVPSPAAPTIIGPMLPSAATTATAPLPATTLPPASAGAAVAPAAAGANPYSQYTAAQYAAMTPEQQYALQQHWMQWQKYQEEYARWHAQYGEQYKREMELAQKNTTAAPAVPAATDTSVYASSYYQQPPPSAPSSKITGQPQLYKQPPPPQAPNASSSNTLNYPPLGHAPAAEQQAPWQPPQQPPSFNQPPPNFNQQNSNANNPNLNTQQFQQAPWGCPGVPPPSRQTNSDNSQYNNRNDNGNRGASTGVPNAWQGPPNNRGADNFTNNNAGNRGNGPNNRSNNWGNNQNAGDGNGPSDDWNNSDGVANRNFGLKNRFDGNPSTSSEDNVLSAEKNMPIENENMTTDNVDSTYSGPNNRNIGGPNNWAGRGNQGVLDASERNRGQNRGPNERNFGQINRGSDNNIGPNNWNDGPNTRGNNGPNDNPNNRGSNDRGFGSNNRGPNNWNQGPNNRGPNNWNDGPNNRGLNNWNEDSNNRGPNNWNEGSNNQGTNNWNDGPNVRINNDWSDNRTTNDRGYGSNNRGPNNWNDSSNNRCGSSNAQNDYNDSSNIRGMNDRNFGQPNRGNNRLNDRGNSGHGKRGPDNSDYPNNRGRSNDGQNQGNYPGPSPSSGTGNRNRITDLDEEMFDRQFRQWEQQFEDWKKANANHPDREMYKRYEQEFEKQRKRIAERREQMRRRKLEQMGLDPNQPPPQPSPNHSRKDSVGNDNSDNPESISRKRNDSTGSQQSSNTKQNQEHNPEIISTNAQETQPQTPMQNDKVDELTKDNENADDIKKVNEESNNAEAINESPQQKVNTSTSLGKRKSRFDTPAAAMKIKPIESTEIINLDDDDADMEQVDDNQKMSEIFKKVDGIPGLDLTDDTSSDPTATLTIDKSPLKPETEPGQNKFPKSQVTPIATQKKIPSLFDIKVDKPDMSDLNDVKEQTPAPAPSTALPDLAKTLNDPDFLKRISEAVAHANCSDKSKVQDVDGRQLSFSEWQQRKQDENETKPNADPIDLDNTNSGGFRDKGSNRSENGEDLNPNANANSGGGENRGDICLPNNMGAGNTFGPNNNFGPNGPSNWPPNGNNWGPNGPNIWGPNGPNNGGPNGPNNWGPNGTNNWGPNNNFGPNGPNNWGPNGPNNWGPNGPNNWGPNGPTNWGPNGPDNNFRGNFGPNGPGRNFGGNGGPNFGPNDGPGRNFGRNDGPGRNFGRNGPNFGRNSSNFGSNDGTGRNFGGDGNNYGPNDGPGRNFGGDGPNFGPNDGPGGHFGRDGPDGNRRNRGRGGSNDRRDGSKNRSENSNNSGDNRNNSSKDGNNSEDTGSSNRNINNPFRRNDGPKVPSLETDDAIKSKNQTDSWIKGPDDRDNLDYGDYYRPVQIIDYSNSNAAPTTTITPRVIDYGHKPVVNDDRNAFKPLKIINYDHASKAKNPQQQTRFNATQKRRKRKNKNNPQQQNQQHQKQNKQQHQQQRQEAKQIQPLQNATIVSNEVKDVQEQNNVADAMKEHDELEEISDVEDMPEEPQSPPPPPPPMFSTSGTFTPFALQGVSTSIFPSTSDANENLPKMSANHVQMSIPTEENNNTISIDEILMKPGRQTRPKKICMILRGPPGSGKSHVAKLIKEKEKEMGGNNPRILSIDDYFIIENDYEEKCPKTGKKVPKKEILYEYDKDMEEKYLEYLIKAFKKSVADNFYDFIVIDCNNNSLRSLNEFYCHSKDSGFVPYIIDLFCDLETCLERNIHERAEKDIKDIIDTWKPTPGHYIKLDISSLLENIVEMEDAEDMAVDENAVSENADSNMTAGNDQYEADDDANEGVNDNNEDNVDDNDDEDSNDSISNCGFLKSKWETDTTTENLARLDGTSKLSTKRKPTMEEYLQMDEWQPPKNTKGKKRVRWADIEEKRNQAKMRAVGFVVGQTDWKRMMDPNAAKRALNKTKYIERVNKKR